MDASTTCSRWRYEAWGRQSVVGDGYVTDAPTE